MITEQMKKRRMAEDAEMIGDPSQWPDEVLHLKTQPWVHKQGTFPIFGYVDVANPLQVVLKDGGTEDFESIEKMVERWSVD